MNQLPTREQLLTPIVKALSILGGSGSVDEINEQVIKIMELPESIITIPHDSKAPDGRTSLEYNLAWARTMLKANGYLQNSKRGIWSLMDSSIEKVKEVDIPNIVIDPIEKENIEEDWKSILLQTIIEQVSPGGFERLVQRFLREKGFTQVEVTGRTGDGGIDGTGIARINGILSFHIVFQCKKYQGAVSASEVRDFRGAMVGRADKGLIITTGYFTRDAIKEATRDGAPTIDLIDGEKFAEKIKELGLGVVVELIEKVTIDAEWFKRI
jgi:restriction system protein